MTNRKTFLLLLEGFYFESNFYLVCREEAFLEEIGNGLCGSIVSVGSIQIFLCVDTSCRSNEKDIFSVSVYYFSSVEDSEGGVLDSSDGICWCGYVDEGLRRERDIKE
jgi:hypothetical protein